MGTRILLSLMVGALLAACGSDSTASLDESSSISTPPTTEELGGLVLNDDPVWWQLCGRGLIDVRLKEYCGVLGDLGGGEDGEGVDFDWPQPLTSPAALLVKTLDGGANMRFGALRLGEQTVAYVLGLLSVDADGTTEQTRIVDIVDVPPGAGDFLVCDGHVTIMDESVSNPLANYSIEGNAIPGSQGMHVYSLLPSPMENRC